MFLVIIAALFYLFRSPVSAQIPLIYQLLEAYHPDSISETSTTPTSIPHVMKPTITIAVIGDSMIDTLGINLPQMANSLKQYYPDRQFRLLNYGVGSSDIEYGIYRLTHDYDYSGTHFPSLISQNPDIVVVESFAYNNYGNSETNINRYKLDLITLTNTIKEKLPNTKIVLAATVAPNSVTYSNGVKDLHLSSLEKIDQTNTIKLYLQNMVDYADSEGFILADAYHPSLLNNEGQPDYINSTDHLHPSTLGGQFFSGIVAGTIFRNKLIE